MASLRDQMLQQLALRLGAIPGWIAKRGDRDQPSTNSRVLAVVKHLGESKRARDTMTYVCTMRIEVHVLANAEDADAILDGANPQRYLDRLVTLVEKAIHSAPWPNQEQFSIEGHEVAPSSESNRIEAAVTLSVTYQHNLDDPEVLNPHFVDA